MLKMMMLRPLGYSLKKIRVLFNVSFFFTIFNIEYDDMKNVNFNIINRMLFLNRFLFATMKFGKHSSKTIIIIELLG
jgi:hypothetical protein